MLCVPPGADNTNALAVAPPFAVFCCVPSFLIVVHFSQLYIPLKMDSSSKIKVEPKENEKHRNNGTYNAPDQKDEECERLRAFILQCPGVSTDSKAMKSALASLDTFSKTNGRLAPSNGLKSSSTRSKKPSLFGLFLRLFGSLVRWLLLDMPVLLVVGLYLSSTVLSHIHDEYLSPQMDLLLYEAERSETEITYYSRVCDEKDITTRNVDDLIMSANVTAQEAKKHMLTHGVSIYHDVIQPETANELRDFILEANKREANYYVIEQEHRYTFGLRFDHHPSVTKAMHEIATHPTLLPALEAIAGPNPAIIEVAPITSEYGAAEQHWHQDTLPMASSFKHARSFFPSYSIFIPLQDTSRRIGSTQVCPGSHVCDEYDGMCQSFGIYVSGEQDLWPQGAAAVMNQHLHHRGTAHTMRGGPERVLLVVTVAPRPLTGRQQVETRQLSEGGSYSLHWKQWGHTLYDFRDVSPSAAKQPWMLLRTLGVYKPAAADWGWDWITTSSMRISNDDNGYHDEQLEEFKDAGGFWFLPAALHGNYDDGWRVFLQETIARTKSFFHRAVLIGVATNFVLTFLWGLLVCRKGIKATFWSWIFRIIMLCALETLLAWLFTRQVEKTPWATHIRQGKSYHLGVASDYGTPYDIPGTLPNRDDVLLTTRYNSRHLWSYYEILDYSHPGNKRFQELVMKSSTGYVMPDTMKRQLIGEIIEQIGQSHGRFLWPNEVGKWSNTPIQRTRLLVHHELVQRANPFVGQILIELSYLVSETEFGYWRTSAISRHISDALEKLRHKIIVPLQWRPRSSLIVLQGGQQLQPVVSRTLTVRSFLPPLPGSNLPELQSVHLRANAFPARPPIEEPFPGAWLKEGDVVEGMYECNFNGKLRNATFM
jgi:hypothetical protein